MPDVTALHKIRVSPRPALRLGALVNWLPAASLLLPAAMLVLAGWLTWREAMSEAFSQIARTAEAAAEYGDRTFETYMAAASRLNDRLRGLTDAEISADQQRMHEELVRLLAETSLITRSFVIDRHGFALVSSFAYPVPRNDLRDRDYFRALSAPGRPPVYISQLLAGRDTGRLQFVVARPRQGSGDPPDENSFEGLVMVTVEPEVLAGSLRRLAAAADYIGLMLAEGHTIARTAGAQAALPPVAASSPFWGVVARGETAATFMGVNRSDGSAALTALRRLDDFPVYAVALRPRATVVAAWREAMLSHLFFGVPATLALFGLSLVVRSNQVRLAEANAKLRLDARRSETRLSRAERLGLFGSFEIDLRTGENFRSAEYMAVQGLPAVARLEGHKDWLRRLHPEDRERAERVVLDAVAPGSTDVDYAQTYRIITPAGDIRWIAARAEIERDADGLAMAMRGAHVDVTSLREAERALANSDARLRLAQEAAGIGTWEWQSGGESRLSRRMLELWGFDRDGLKPGVEQVLARIHPDDRQRIRRETQVALKGGLLRTECRVVRPEPAGGETVIWVMLRASAQHDGPCARLIGIGYDVSERKQAEAEAALLAHEVEHRARNALTVVIGLLRVTQAVSPEQFAEVMEQRVSALSRTMSLLGRNRFRGADLRALLEDELEPYRAAATLAGEPLMLSADLAQPLSMAVHELATNAAKYGALSVPQGRLNVAWAVVGEQMTITWEECGGPVLSGPPDHEGFGSTLIEQTFIGRLNGGIKREWRPAGLFCLIHLDLRESEVPAESTGE